MPPKKHMKFGDDGGNVDTLDVPKPRVGRAYGNKLKKSQGSKALNQYLSSSSPIPGPLNLQRLHELESGDALLSESDARFGRSGSSAPESPESDSDNSESTDIEEPTKVDLIRDLRKTAPINGHVKDKKKPIRKSGSNVYFFDSDDEEPVVQAADTPQSLKQKASALLKDRQTLPIYKSRVKVMEHIKSNPVTVLLGETGSGKSTQLPQLIYAHGENERIAITQPRRVAAINLATRVADEMGVSLGGRVGYSVRFQNRSNPRDTHIKYLTDGMLMREMMLDPKLSKYTTVILDEAHERTVITDILMGLLKQLRASSRPDLRIIIMSATLDAEKFSKFFDDAEILYVEGRKYHVDRFYVNSTIEDVVDGVIQTACQTNLAEPSGGDILCFLPGQDDIDRCVEKIESIAEHMPKTAPLMVPIPLYASLPNNLQQRAFQKLGAVPGTKRSQRKVIFATNIAETSVTIPGVKYVIDSGLRKIRVWKPVLGLDSLLTCAISQASAQQRMGRAGREGPGGKCFRLFTEDTYMNDLIKQTEPEIVRCDVASTVLTLKNLGVANVLEFPWLEPPSMQAITSSLYQLYQLGALDDNGEITNLGRQMALLPLAPSLSAILIKAAGSKENSSTQQLLDTILDITACLSVDDLLVTPRPNERDEINAKKAELFSRGVQYGDLIMLADMYKLYQEIPSNARREWCKSVGINFKAMKTVVPARDQLVRYLRGILPWLKDISDSNPEEKVFVSPEEILQCFLEGYRANVALGQSDRRYRTIGNGGQVLSIHPSSMMFGARVEAIMYLDYVFTSKAYARCVSSIDPKWLLD